MIIGNPKMIGSKKQWHQRSLFLPLKFKYKVKITKKNSSTLPFLKDFKIIHDYSIAYPWFVLLFGKKGHLYDLSRALQIYILIIT